MNKVNLIGNLTNDPILRYTKQNTPVASYSIAVNTGYGEKQETLFINVATWGKPAELISKYLTKGQKVAIIGRLKNNSYEDDKGNKHNSILVVTEEIEFIGNKKEENSFQGQVMVSTTEQPIVSSYTTKQPITQEKNKEDDLYSQFDLTDADLPF